ncbi:hypothetical protein ACHAWF_003756 [Thalassiosira exigua]
MRCQLDQFLVEGFNILPKNEKIHFCCLKEKTYDRVIGKFYLTAKDCTRHCGKQDLFPTYIRDSYHMLEELDKFGTHIIQQLCGAAMGTPCVCMYATIYIYYCYHEIYVLLAKYKRYLILYKWIIDNGFGIWNDKCDPGAWDCFCYDVNVFVGCKLKWVIDERREEDIL